MIRFEPTPAPDGFAEHVEKPGAAWLAAHETGCPPDYWRRFREDLAHAFGSFRAYGAMIDHATHKVLRNRKAVMQRESLC